MPDRSEGMQFMTVNIEHGQRSFHIQVSGHTTTSAIKSRIVEVMSLPELPDQLYLHCDGLAVPRLLLNDETLQQADVQPGAILCSSQKLVVNKQSSADEASDMELAAALNIVENLNQQ
jgi:hypothetical protein